MSRLIKTFVYLVITIICLYILLGIIVYKIQGSDPDTGETQMRFHELPFPFEYSGDLSKSLPFMGLATVDVNGDGIDEIMVGAGKTQPDALFKYENSGFTKFDVAGLNKKDGDATFGIASIDTTGDALEELFIARESGVYYAENIGGEYSQRKLEFGMADNTTPLSIALGDINRDGWVDLYVAGYIKLEMAEGETNFRNDYGGYSYLLLNNGSNQWHDISNTAGVFRQHNTFLGMFIDLNDDQWPDLIVAEDTGKVEIWENLKNNTFKRHSDPTDYAYPMGIGAGDIDNDGDVDLYFSNVGTTLPRKMLIGNLTKDQTFNMDYILLRNDGDFTFTDIAKEVNAAKYGFGWGTTIADFNSDSHMDLYFSQNYARFPGVKYMKLYPGRLLEQQPDATFLSVEESAGIANPNFGITQVVSDFNQDGRLDMVIANLNGPTRAFLSENTGENVGLTVRLPSTPIWLNTVGVVKMNDGKLLKRQMISGEGLCSDGYQGLHFGLGASAENVTLTLARPDGHTVSFDKVSPGKTLSVKE